MGLDEHDLFATKAREQSRGDASDPCANDESFYRSVSMVRFSSVLSGSTEDL